MEIAYFKTSDPNQKIYLTRIGRWIQWQQINEVIGVIVCNKPEAIADIRDLIRRGIGGASEISGEEFAQLQAKKKDPRKLQQPWREELPINRKPMQTASPDALNLKKDASPAATDGTQGLAHPLNRAPLPDSLRPQARK